MKNTILLSLLVALLMVTCSKEHESQSNDNVNTGEWVVDKDFDWRMSKNLELTLSNATEVVFQIHSPDGRFMYHKGRHPGNDEAYVVQLSIPFTEDHLVINGETHAIAGNSMQIGQITQNHVFPPFTSGYEVSRDGSIDNYAMGFDGSEDYLNLGDLDVLNASAAFTIEAWSKPNSTSSSESFFIKEVDDQNSIHIRTEAGKLIVELSHAASSQGSWNSYQTEIASGSWFHWAVVYNGGAASNAERLKLYTNGQQKTFDFSGNIPTTSADLSGQSATLSSPGQSFTGIMDEVRVWSVSRTQTEIQSLYEQIIPPMTTYLEANWRLDEGEGYDIYDETDHARHATRNGCEWQQYVNHWDSDSDGIADIDDDHPLDYHKAFDNFYPASNDGTIAFEDIWPCLGDADYNDLIMGYQFQTITNPSNHVIQIVGHFTIRANGAVQENGFGFELPDASSDVFAKVSVSGYEHTTGTIQTHASGFESGQDHPTVMVVDNITKSMPGYSNTVDWMVYEKPTTITIIMDVNEGSTMVADDFSISTWNPFIFIHKIRKNEVHLLNYSPTNLANTSNFGQCADASNPLQNLYYRTAGNVAWGLDFPVAFDYPVENTDISLAYPHFRDWVNSGGTMYADWYDNHSDGYRKEQFIYQVPE